MSRICHGICHRYKSKKRVRPVYDNHRRCTKCEVLFGIDTIKCPCCSCITRSRPAKHIKPTMRIDSIEIKHIHSKMLRD